MEWNMFITSPLTTSPIPLAHYSSVSQNVAPRPATSASLGTTYVLTHSSSDFETC